MNPQGAKHRRILSTKAGSDPFVKFSTLSDFSTGYKASELTGPNLAVSNHYHTSAHTYDLILSILFFHYVNGRIRTRIADKHQLVTGNENRCCITAQVTGAICRYRII